jgi:hypothetical protein
MLLLLLLFQIGEFFTEFGSDLLSGAEAEEWRPWFALAHIHHPERLPIFQVGGSKGLGLRV